MALKKKKFDKFLQEDVKDHHQILTNRVIQRLEEALTYKKAWITCTELPMNPVTGTVYKGVNCLSLLIAQFNDNRFYTYKNVQELAEKTGENIHVKKGEKGIPVFKAMQKTFSKTNEDTQEEKQFGFWVQIYAGTVFNATQIEGLPPVENKHTAQNKNIAFVPQFTVNQDIELIAKSLVEMTGLSINHHHRGVAYYQRLGDSVNIPEKENFINPSSYYRTLMHELGHATGSEKRLNRKQNGNFGDANYAFEELVAELSSYFMGNEVNLEYQSLTDDNHIAYMKSWLGALRDDKNMIFRASAQASRAVEYQLGIKNDYLLSLEQNPKNHETHEPHLNKPHLEKPIPHKISKEDLVHEVSDNSAVEQPKKLKMA